MEPVYGNHIGVVISDQGDPEGRGRVKIWVPHLNKTVYKDWNETLLDKKFKSSESSTKGSLGLTTEILNDLIETLPWAESAVPTFGGGTSGAVKTIGTQRQAMPNDSFKGIPEVDAAKAEAEKIKALSNPSPMGINKEADPQVANKAAEVQPLQSINDLPDNVLKYLAGTAATETGAFVDSNSTGKVTREAYNYDITKANTKLNNPPDNKIDRGYFQINGDDVKAYSSSGLTYNGTLADQTISTAKFIQNKYPEAWNLILAGDFTGADSYINEFFHGPRDNPDTAASARSADASTLRDYIAKFDANPDNLKNQEAELANNNVDYASQKDPNAPTPVRFQNNVAAAFKSGQAGYGSANGYYSNPAVGAKVWVFFYGGDVQRPVWFASVPEKIGYKVATQT